MNMLKKIFYVIAFLIGGIISSHYIEIYELNLLLKLRNFVYFNTFSDKSSDGFRNYKTIQDKVYNPVNHIQITLPQVRFVLSDRFHVPYYRESQYDKIDTAQIITVSKELMLHVDTIIIDNNICYRLAYNFSYSQYNLHSGWFSGMAQGHAIEQMIGTYLLTNDSTYLRNACYFANLLNLEIERGGVQENVYNGIWFEEYAQNGNDPHPFVLNGHIFALDGLFWLSKIYPNSIYKKLFYEGVNAVEANIHRYSIPFWSKYDIHYLIANGSYHRIHIVQLGQLLTLGDYPNINKARQNFILGKYIPFGIFYRLIYNHNNMLLAVIFINSILLSLIIFIIKKTIKSN
jgi:uncharacterized protein (UPF0297 family)